MIKRARLPAALVLLATVTAAMAVAAGSSSPQSKPASFGQTAWTRVRDGVVYVRTQTLKEIDVAWENAWEASGHRETIYFQNPTGKLLQRRRIGFDEPSGRETFRTIGSGGDFRLEIPGLSYRYYDIYLPVNTPSVFQPAKLHHSCNLDDRTKLYFAVPIGHAFRLCGKFFGGVTAMTAISPEGKRHTLTLVKRKSELDYSIFDQLEIPAQNRAGIWTLTFKVQGNKKAAFWLDGIPNYFAKQPKSCFLPLLEPGKANVKVTRTVMGARPKLGANLPFANLPPQGYAILKKMGLQSGNFYAFQEAFGQGKSFRDRKWLKIYENELGIKDYLVICLADRKKYKGQPPPLDELKPFSLFIQNYVASHRGADGLALPYISFQDEPNSRFKTADQFAEFHRRLARPLKESSNRAVNRIKIGAPESAGLINGPTKRGSAGRRGADWVAKLLKSDWNLVDAISWHEWMIRDLIATEWYRESVEEAWKLQQKYAPAGAEPKDLLITQTNIGSGGSFSPYEDATFFGALWWASVVANSAAPGKLKMLNWAPAFDEKGGKKKRGVRGEGGKAYSKGLVAHDKSGAHLKPVGVCMEFLNNRLLPEVISGSSDAIEVDMLATTDGGKRIGILMVNKADRQQSVQLSCELPDSWRKISWSLETLDQSGKISEYDKGRSVVSQEVFSANFDIQGNTVYFLNIKSGG